MASKTPNLGLVKPDLGEFTDSWNIPLNKNFDLIDEAIGNLESVTDAAKGTASSLDARLSVSLNADGSLKDIPEVAKARNSTVYGADNGTDDFVLDDRIERGDREVYDARSGATALLDAHAALADDFVPNSVISAPVSFLTFTGANIKVDGSVTPIICNINGYRRVVRKLIQTTVSGSSGTYFIYLNKNLSGEIILDRTAGGQNTGATNADGFGDFTRFTDSTQNFVTSGVQAGDIIEITTTGSPNKYQYVVASVVGANELTIVGRFESVQANLNYKITNPLAPTLGFTATPHSFRYSRANDLIYIGRCVFDGSNVTSVTQYQPKGRYEAWFSVSLTAGDYEVLAQHNIGFVPTKLSLYASQANDFTQPLEPIAVCQVSGSGVTDDRAAVSDMTDTLIRVKNATNGVFYKDYSGVTQVSGFLFVIAER